MTANRVGDILDMEYMKQPIPLAHLTKTLLIVLLTLVSCNRHHDVDGKLDLADRLMTDKPDSALSVLNKIDVSHLNGSEVAARYALLKSTALDKNCVDTTTFDVLQPAIDYYLVHGDVDEKLMGWLMKDFEKL